ncbi:alkaline ceramidase ydc1 [Coemansia biformis]|uniref:Alkaline ceramidase ydc1 n=1 Tax=Coemansia biformis TaxID=1286918 RepID=A0A9W7Y8R2_9FUNG|nr:alkaline ceramidase ydc1 [Coemansia biformis]
MAMITLAALGIYSAVKHRHGKRTTALYVGLLVVGFGSTAFHATLKYTTQLLDELPMLYLCAVGLYAVIEHDRAIKFGIKVPVVIGLFQVAITLAYLFWLQNPIFHQVAFALTAFSSVVFGYKRLHEMEVSSETRRLLYRLNLYGYLGMLGGFLVWNIDNIFCHQLRSYRTYVGAPLDALLQLHGWWHIMTAYGSTYLLLWTHMIRLARLGHDHLFSIHYFLGLFPYVDLNRPKRVD